MKQSSYLIKPASSLCNMNCLYCFYSDVSKHRETYSKGIMKKETVDMLIRKALNDSDDITFAFQGGEPIVAGIDYFKYFTTLVDSLKTNQIIHSAIQTNGYAINEEWISLFKKYNFLVGISLDGYKDIHDEVRLKRNKETFDIRLNEKNIIIIKNK